MSKSRIFAVSFVSLAMAISSFVGIAPAYAVDGPTLTSAVAKDEGNAAGIQQGDKIVLTFSEETNEFAITENNIDDILVLSNNHTFLDGEGDLANIDWGDSGMKLTIELDNDTTLPTVAVGDTITITGDDLEDEDGNEFSGSVTLTGSFAPTSDDDDDDQCEEPTMGTTRQGRGSDDDDDDAEEADEDSNDDDEDSDNDEDSNEDCDNSGNQNKVCNDALKNGKLYKIGSEATVYLAVKHCYLKPFRGMGAFKARGHKFSDIITLSAVPSGVTVLGEPALPAEGTLVKGSNKTVWFVTNSGKRRGFINADIFIKLGFKFEAVKEISDSDLNELPVDTTNVADDTKHPDGSIIKCGNSSTVFLVKEGKRKAFPSLDIFEGRGHSFEHILSVDCGRFAYTESGVVTDVE